ncbi:MAG TPA: hypothetical protein PLD88_15600, partial [Candidatus Berkiella sp.]|nr:hypothetical protein [Candidatus Berkiella sp.]
ISRSAVRFRFSAPFHCFYVGGIAKSWPCLTIGIIDFKPEYMPHKANYLISACSVAILLSDTVLSLLQFNQEVLSWVVIAKIWVLIILCAGLLYYLIRNRTNILLA